MEEIFSFENGVRGVIFYNIELKTTAVWEPQILQLLLIYVKFINGLKINLDQNR